MAMTPSNSDSYRVTRDRPLLRAPSGRARRIAGWTLGALLALVFLGAGIPKLLGFDTPSGSHADFERWGYPPIFRAFVGLGETAGALLLLVPGARVLGAPLRFWGALGLAADMLGAAATHVVHGEAAAAAVPLGALALCATLALLLRPARAPASASAPRPDASR